MKLDLNLLRVLVAIHESGSVTKAAQQLGMSQPAVSAALGRLRESLADPLFIRQADGMLPTPRADTLAGKARQVLDAIDHDILRPPEFDPQADDVEFVFCLSAIGEIVFLPTLLRHIREQAPRALVKSVSLAPEQLEEALGCGEVDLALGYFPDLKKAEFFQRRLFSHDFVCMVRSGHRIKGPRMTLNQFATTEQVFVKDGSRTQERVEAALAQKAVKRNVVLQTSHYLSIPIVIAESDLVVVLPRTVADVFSDLMDVRVVEPPVEIPRYDLKVYWHRRFGQDPKVKWLRERVIGIFAEQA
ncbi:LysR family transcriptional regulator [Paraburkholderia pallida]|uniref:LysR family transcriptional regulator n=1 Tax=Paraburkholderia pallida TaxID=2547399 RepID=A0A4P7CYL9_9BURK|nr:LysR family transcriptional regulator [Paraburkholderia pallida]QBR01399.1 LysR family transcriptional regulator [Paraburkholderia pallida]